MRTIEAVKRIGVLILAGAVLACAGHKDPYDDPMAAAWLGHDMDDIVRVFGEPTHVDVEDDGLLRVKIVNVTVIEAPLVEGLPRSTDPRPGTRPPVPRGTEVSEVRRDKQATFWLDGEGKIVRAKNPSRRLPPTDCEHRDGGS